jgi:hypothetical protein
MNTANPPRTKKWPAALYGALLINSLKNQKISLHAGGLAKNIIQLSAQDNKVKETLPHGGKIKGVDKIIFLDHILST